MVLRRELQALHFAFARVALISLAAETWTLLSDDLSSVILDSLQQGQFLLE